jgi:hypothetical protein
MAKTVETKLDKLIPDNINANKGTEYGQHLVEKSLREFGAGRSILIDKNNRIIAGNKTVENAAAIGLEKVIIVETTGDQIVAVKRTDIDLDSREGRELAIADNASAKANIEWDEKNIQQIQSDWAIDPQDWGIPEFKASEEDEEEVEQDQKMDISTRLIVECGDVMKLSSLFSELQDRGFKCELKE